MATTSNLPCTAALLMGGRSVRMGRDKAELIFDGVPLWQRQLQTLEHTGAAEIVVSGNAGRRGRTGRYPLVVDEVEGQGPLRALATLLRRSAFPGTLLLGVDLPAITPEFLRELAIAGLAEGRTLVPDDGDRLQPLAAFYSRHCLPLVDEQLTSGAFSLHAFLERATAAGLARRFPLVASQRRLFVNLNTPRDVEAFFQPDTR